MASFRNLSVSAAIPSVVPTNLSYSLPNDSAFSIYFNVFNPDSILYTNTPSQFGITVGLLKFILHGVGVTSLCVFGVIGNFISILVLSSPQMGNSSTSYYLRCLAICDSIAIICVTLVVGVPSLLVFNPDGERANSTWLVFNKQIVQYSSVVWTPPVYQTAVIFLTGTVLFTMALTMDRYFAVCKPLLTLKYDICSRQRARIVSVVLFIGDILYNLPRYWEYEYLQFETEFSNLTCYLPVPTSLRRNFYYDACYVHASYVLMLFLTPVIHLIVFNIIIYREIRRARTVRETIVSSAHAKFQDTSLSYMLFGIVIAFIMCQVIPVSHASYRYASGDVGTDAYVPEVEFLMSFFFVLNSSVNFLIYCVSGSKFRNAMFSVFTCKWKATKIRKEWSITTKI